VTADVYVSAIFEADVNLDEETNTEAAERMFPSDSDEDPMMQLSSEAFA